MARPSASAVRSAIRHHGGDAAAAGVDLVGRLLLEVDQPGEAEGERMIEVEALVGLDDGPHDGERLARGGERAPMYSALRAIVRSASAR